MCITIPTTAHTGRSREIPLWRWLRDSPARLFPAGGLLATLLWLWRALFGESAVDAWMVFDLLFGVLPFFLFGQLLARLPLRLGVTPPRYSSYGMLFFLMLAAQLLVHFSNLPGGGMGLGYLLLVAVSWWVLLRLVFNFLKFSYRTRRTWDQALFYLLLWGGAMGGLTLLSLRLGWITTPLGPLLAGISYLLPASLIVLIAMVKTSPD